MGHGPTFLTQEVLVGQCYFRKWLGKWGTSLKWEAKEVSSERYSSMTQRTRKNQFCKDEGQDMGQREQNSYSPLWKLSKFWSTTEQQPGATQLPKRYSESVRETSMVYWISMAGRTWCQVSFCFHIPIRWKIVQILRQW